MKNTKIENGYLFPKAYTNYIFILLFLLYMFDYIDRMVVTSMFVSLHEDWGLTKAQSGMLVSAVYWSIAILTIPISIFIDRWSRKKTIGLMAVVWSIATGICALTGNFTQLLLARILIGVGEAGYAPGGTAMIANLYPQEKRARQIGIWNASIPLGSAIGVTVGGIIAARWGWKHAFGLVAIPGFIIAIMFFFVKDYKTVNLQINNSINGKVTKARMNFTDIVSYFSKKPSLIYTILGMASVSFVTSTLMVWLPTYLQFTLGISQEKSGFKAGIVMVLAIIGAPLGGYLTDRWRKHKIRARLLFPTITTGLSAFLLFVGLNYASGLMQYIVLLFFGTSVVAFVSAASAVTQDVVHAGLRAISYSIAVMVQNLLGSSIAPVVIGALADSTNIQTAFKCLPWVLVLGTLFFFLGSRHYENDFNRVEKVQLEPES
jgi:MFS family permease